MKKILLVAIGVVVTVAMGGGVGSQGGVIRITFIRNWFRRIGKNPAPRRTPQNTITIFGDVNHTAV